MKKFWLLISGLLFAVSSIAQDNVSLPKSFRDDPLNHPMLPFYLAISFGFIALLLMVVVGVYVFTIIKFLRRKKSKTETIDLKLQVQA